MVRTIYAAFVPLSPTKFNLPPRDERLHFLEHQKTTPAKRHFTRRAQIILGAPLPARAVFGKAIEGIGAS